MVRCIPGHANNQTLSRHSGPCHNLVKNVHDMQSCFILEGLSKNHCLISPPPRRWPPLLFHQGVVALSAWQLGEFSPSHPRYQLLAYVPFLLFWWRRQIAERLGNGTSGQAQANLRGECLHGLPLRGDVRPFHTDGSGDGSRGRDQASGGVKGAGLPGQTGGAIPTDGVTRPSSL